MSSFTFGSIEEAKLLCTMFQDKESFLSAIAIVIAETVGLKDWEQLIDGW